MIYSILFHSHHFKEDNFIMIIFIQWAIIVR